MIPFHVRKQTEEQLRRDVELSMIEYIEGPTLWVSSIVVVPKPKSPGKIWAAVDLLQVSRAIKEMISDLNCAKIFRRLDLNQEYNQLVLTPESRYITTSSTHMGLMRYKRLNFYISITA